MMVRRPLAALALLALLVVLAPAPVAALTDTDRDGLYDTFETQKSLTSPRSADLDRDGIRDGAED
ncbi:MAG: hypothetical protein ACYC65_14385, partial [Candidatus Limnocylindrales bacterium]